MNYVENFARPDQAAEYDEVEYGPATYASLIWSIEAAQLRGVVTTSFRGQHSVEALDFATGTGRVAALIEPMVTSSTAIDVSHAMVGRAAERLKSTTLIVGDVTDPSVDLAQDYDLITAFRFLLNVERDVAINALVSLRKRLRPEGLLIINNHGNLWSHKAVAVPGRVWTRYVRKERHVTGNILSHGQAKRMFNAAGLRIVAQRGCGLLGGRAAKFLPAFIVLVAEKAFSRSWFHRFGSNQLYVLKKVVDEKSAPAHLS